MYRFGSGRAAREVSCRRLVSSRTITALLAGLLFSISHIFSFLLSHSGNYPHSLSSRGCSLPFPFPVAAGDERGVVP